MKLSWDNIENLEDYFITYLLYKEPKTVSQISKIRNIEIGEINEHLIKAKMEIKALMKSKVESSKDIIDKFLELGKEDRIKLMNSLDEDNLLIFKRKIYKRIMIEKNAEDLMILIWATGELNDDRFLKILHQLTNHRHSDVRRITYSALRKISSIQSREIFHKGLYDPNPQTRQYCAKALASVGNENTILILKKLKQNSIEKNYVIRAYEEAINQLEKTP